MASSPELFVVCKNCNSQVSPYITECPYCGTRLRKRAPKIERAGAEAPAKKRRRVTPSLGPLRTGEIPGIRGDEHARPIATITLVAVALLWWLAVIPLRDEAVRLYFDPLGEWWQVLTAPFMQANGWYQFAALGAVALFGWLLERRNGPVGRRRDLAARRERRPRRRQGGRGAGALRRRLLRRARAAVRVGGAAAARAPPDARATTTSTCSAPR